MSWQALWLTLQLAGLVASILLLIGVPVAYWISFSRSRFVYLIEAFVALPIVLPPTVLGFYLLIAFGSDSETGRWFQSLTGHPLAFTFEGLVVGSIIYSLPFAVQPFATSFSAVEPNLLAASQLLGASRLRTFVRIIVPQSLPGLISGVALSFAHTIGEFGVVLMIGGNIPGVTRTISIDIYDRVQAGEYAAANQTALFLLILSFLILALIYGLNRKVWTAWRFK